jgi:hypothetical protein
MVVFDFSVDWKCLQHVNRSPRAWYRASVSSTGSCLVGVLEKNTFLRLLHPAPYVREVVLKTLLLPTLRSSLL